MPKLEATCESVTCVSMENLQGHFVAHLLDKSDGFPERIACINGFVVVVVVFTTIRGRVPFVITSRGIVLGMMRSNGLDEMFGGQMQGVLHAPEGLD